MGAKPIHREHRTRVFKEHVHRADYIAVVVWVKTQAISTHAVRLEQFLNRVKCVQMDVRQIHREHRTRAFREHVLAVVIIVVQALLKIQQICITVQELEPFQQ